MFGPKPDRLPAKLLFSWVIFAHSRFTRLLVFFTHSIKFCHLFGGQNAL